MTIRTQCKDELLEYALKHEITHSVQYKNANHVKLVMDCIMHYSAMFMLVSKCLLVIA